MTTTPSDFQARAAAATARALSATNPAEALARSLTADVPKITSAVKSFMSLVAARSLSTSPTDDATDAQQADRTGKEPRAVFRKTDNPNKAALLCARALLSAVNSTLIPADDEITTGAVAPSSGDTETNGDGKEDGATTEDDVDERLERDVVRLVWNGLVKKAAEDGAGPTTTSGRVAGGVDTKPSKVLGRRCLVQTFPHVLRRLQKQDSVLLPAGVEEDEAVAFFGEFGRLLASPGASNQSIGPNDEDDDGALLWSTDGGAAELKRRRERRVKRGKEAVERAENKAKGVVTAAVSGGLAGGGLAGGTSSLTIEEIQEGEEEDEDTGG